MSKITRMHGPTQGFNRGHTLHQDKAHRLLKEEGFEFDRMTTKSGNVYRHSDGRRIVVQATPRNSSNDLNYIRQSIQKEGTMATTTKPTTPLVAMADPFLLKEPTDRRGIGARRSAMLKWTQRALERNGPVPSPVLFDAADEIGFNKLTFEKIRKDAGVIVYRQDGVNWACLEHQLPEGAVRLGRGRKETPNGVVSEAVEPPEHPIGENNGEGPEPREERSEDYIAGAADTASTLIKAGWSASGLPGLKPLPKDWVGPAMTPRSPESAAPTPTQDGDVTAAAQLLLSSLGLKTADPDVAVWAREAHNLLQRAQADTKVAMERIERIIRSHS